MRLLLAFLLFGGPGRAQDAAFDALAELFTRDAPTDEAAAKTVPERGETLARLTADLTLAAQGLESFRSPDDTTTALKYAPDRVPPELRHRFSSRERALDTLYRTLAVADYTWATRFPDEKCSASDRRARLLSSADGLFKDPKTGLTSPWLVHLLGPDAAQNAEAALDKASAAEPAKGRDYELLRAKAAKITAALAVAPEDKRAWLHCLRAETYETLSQANQVATGPITASRGTIPSRGVALIGKLENGVFEAYGSGVLITTKTGARILTDAKVVEDEGDYLAAFSDKGKPLRIKVERKGPELALLSSLDDLGEGRELSASDPAKNDLVTVVSNSERLGAWAWTQGLVSDTQEGLFQTDAVVDAGQAGGAVLDENGRLAGLLTLRDAEAEDGEGLWPVGVPASKVKAWLEGGELQTASRPVTLQDAGTSSIIQASYYYTPTPWGTIRSRCVANCGGGSSYSRGYSSNPGAEALGRAMGQAIGQGVRALFKGLGSMFRSKGNGFAKRSPKPRSSSVAKAAKPKPVEPPKPPPPPPPPPPEPVLYLSLAAEQPSIGPNETGVFTARVTSNRPDAKLDDIKITFKATDAAGNTQEKEAWTDASGVAKLQVYLPPSVAAHKALDDESAKHPWLTNASSPGKRTVCRITVTALGALAVTASLAPVASVALAGGGTAVVVAGTTPLPVTACAAIGAGLAALSQGTCNLMLGEDPKRAVEAKPSREFPEASPPARAVDPRPKSATRESVEADASAAHDDLTRMAKEMAAQEGGANDGAMGQPADPGEDPPQSDGEGPDEIRITQERLEHIVRRHWASSDAPEAGKFSSEINGRKLLELVNSAARHGKSYPNTRNRPGKIIEHTFSRDIGVDMRGRPTRRLRMIIGPDKTLFTAFPF